MIRNKKKNDARGNLDGGGQGADGAGSPPILDNPVGASPEIKHNYTHCLY